MRNSTADAVLGLWMTGLNVRYFDDGRACKAECHEHGFAFYDANPTVKHLHLAYNDMHHAHNLSECRSVPNELPYAPFKKDWILQSADEAEK